MMTPNTDSLRLCVYCRHLAHSKN